MRPACLKQSLLVGALQQRGLLLLLPWALGSLHGLVCLLVLLPSPNWQQVHLLPVHLASLTPLELLVLLPPRQQLGLSMQLPSARCLVLLRLVGCLSVQHESPALELQDLALELLSQLPLSILL